MKFHIPFLLFLFTLSFFQQSQAQGELRPIYFSGFILDDNADPLPGVHIYLPQAGQGTTTDVDGYFWLPTLVGDSVVISYIGYKTHYYIMPYRKESTYSVLIDLVQDNTSLPVVEIFPYPTEELFKEAVLALELPESEKLRTMRENLDERVMTRLAYEMAMDADLNYTYYMQQHSISLGNRFFNPTLQLLNPFAWGQFIKSIKRGDFKKGRWKKD